MLLLLLLLLLTLFFTNVLTIVATVAAGEVAAALQQWKLLCQFHLWFRFFFNLYSLFLVDF